MNDHCSCCGLTFYPEGGYYLGSIYVNYGATVAILLIAFFVFRAIPERYELVFFSCLAALVSFGLFRHSRSLWLTIDFSINPWKPPESSDDVAAPKSPMDGG
jgi:hypothetical protein